ncbi:helix-turn-helix domain-containing protein [Nocardia sp. NPDC050406]|uniref:helix-turn-helix domain-containing protein n=1 Tax=Nocardia sp. NPDC050406 TaxID=3364318 RepID=UPI00378D65A2
MTTPRGGHCQEEVATPRPRPDRADIEGGQRADTTATAAESTHGRVMAWAGFVFGSVTSIAANVLHAWLPADTMPPGWTPGIAPQVGAAIWPIGLLLSVEVLSRARWQRGGLWRLARYGGAGTVALGSAIISYGHVRDVLLAWGYGQLGASVGPLTLDGLMVVSGFALLSMTTTKTAATNPASTDIAASVNGDAVPEVPVPVRSGSDPIAPTVSPRPVAIDGDLPLAMAPDSEDTGADTRRHAAWKLQARGWSHGRIAAELQVSKRTVRRYLSTPPDTDRTPAPALSGPEAPASANTAPAVSEEIETNHHRPLEGALT